ncbi:hypothetical protein OA668_02765, partial [Candidatus Pelagibacter sp.]|nr:hypothetical protein [Candidatus Pelagibacter sp.]
LAKELSKRSTGRTMYILDEPTTGLHQHDIKKLLEILHTFVKLGNTVVVIEHNLDVIKTADYIVDMGPEGGVKGGKIIAEGKPEEVTKIKDEQSGQDKYSTEVVIQGYNSSLTMLGGGNGGGIQNDPNPQNNIEDTSQISNDMDDEIPF